jgi:hypothetical protein
VLQAADATEAALAVYALRVEGGHLPDGTKEATFDPIAQFHGGAKRGYKLGVW